jgi:hypothetical protein
VSTTYEPWLKAFHGAKMRLNPSADWAPHPNLFIAHEIHARHMGFGYPKEVYEFTFPYEQPIIDFLPSPLEPRFPSAARRPDLLQFCNKWEPEEVQKLVIRAIIEEELRAEDAEGLGEDEDEEEDE